MPARKDQATSVEVHVIHPTGIYTAEDAKRALRLRKGTIAREVRLGRLRVAKRGHRYYFLGEWLLDWLRGGELKRKADTPAV